MERRNKRGREWNPNTLPFKPNNFFPQTIRSKDRIKNNNKSNRLFYINLKIFNNQSIKLFKLQEHSVAL